MFWAAGYYFFIFAALGALYPFLPLLLRSRDLTATQVGLVMVVFSLAKIFSPPLWGRLADQWASASQGTHSGRVRLLILLPWLSTIGLLLLMRAESLSDFMVAVAAYAIFAAAIAPISDSVVQPLAGAHYGRVRLWGSVGFALLVLGVGAAGGEQRPEVMLSVTVGLCLAAGLTAAGRWWSSSGWRSNRAAAGGPEEQPNEAVDHCPDAEIGPAQGSPPSLGPSAGLAGWRQGLNRSCLALFVGCAIYYSAHAINDVYLTIHLAAMGFNRIEIGIAIAIGVAAEIAVMWSLARIYPRIGLRSLLLFSAAVAALRWLVLASSHTQSVVLLGQVLHGVTYGLWYPTVVRWVDDHCSRHCPAARSSLQSLAAVSIGVGMFCGNLGGGVLVDSVGSHVAYAVAACLALLALAPFMAIRPAQARTS